MALLCICGICIPYSSLLPIFLILWRPIWSFVCSVFGWEEKKAQKVSHEPLVREGESTAKVHSPINFSEEMNWNDIINKNCLTVCRFTAGWCKPCKAVEPIFFEAASQFSSNQFVTVDVDKHEELFQNLGILAIPHIQLYQNGKLLENLSGDETKKLVQHLNACQPVPKVGN
jgi:thioredoxin 1